MTVLNFPPTAGEPTDGSFTYEENGVIYSWDGVKWTAEGDAAYWSRANTTLSPANAGDNVSTTGTGTFGALTGRTTTPAAGQIGEVLVSNTDIADFLFTQGIAETIALTSPLDLTAGVWKIDASIRPLNLFGTTGNLAVGDTLNFSIGNINTSGGVIVPLASNSDAILVAQPNQTISSVHASIILSSNSTVNVTGVTYQGAAFTSAGAAYSGWRNRILMRLSAVRIA